MIKRFLLVVGVLMTLVLFFSRHWIATQVDRYLYIRSMAELITHKREPGGNAPREFLLRRQKLLESGVLTERHYKLRTEEGPFLFHSGPAAELLQKLAETWGPQNAYFELSGSESVTFYLEADVGEAILSHVSDWELSKKGTLQGDEVLMGWWFGHSLGHLNEKWLRAITAKFGRDGTLSEAEEEIVGAARKRLVAEELIELLGTLDRFVQRMKIAKGNPQLD